MNDELRRFLGDYDDSDIAFDAVWDEVQQEILDKLAATTDIEAGLAEIVGESASVAPQPDRKADALDTPSEVDAICAELADLLQGLDPLARPDQPAPEGMGGSILYVRAISGLLTELLIGLSRRRLSREDAAWQLRLIDHNLSEARALLSGEHARATKRQIHRSIEAISELVDSTSERIEHLTPRIMRLFKDAGDLAPGHQVPR
jgi:hypothetical protein